MNRKAITSAVAEQPLANVHWIYLHRPFGSWIFRTKGWPLYYYLWHLDASSLARDLHRRIRFDLGHHVTMSTYWLPSVLALLPIPFIWGPVGGGESVPGPFAVTLGPLGQLHEYVRNLARLAAHQEPFLRLTARRASTVLAMTTQSAEILRSLGTSTPAVCPGVALPAEDLATLNGLAVRKMMPFRVLSIGRLLHWKGLHLAIAAFAEFARKFPKSEYWMVGDGPDRGRLEQLARGLHVGEKVRFLGALPRDQAWANMSECDVLLHPSLRDSGGWVCAEAMGARRPVICLDLGGPAGLVTDQSGIKIPASSPEQVVSDFARAMHRLAEDDERRLSMGEAARQRVRDHLCWDRMGEWMAHIYQQVHETQ